eukprot:Rmarinus@m.16113
MWRFRTLAALASNSYPLHPRTAISPISPILQLRFRTNPSKPGWMFQKRGTTGKGGKMITEYRQYKERFPDKLLLYRVGDFYECFEDDAVQVANTLNIILTSRRTDKQRLPMAGIPSRHVDKHVYNLASRGHGVVVVDQIHGAPHALAESPSDPSSTPKIPSKSRNITRAVTRIVTPGTVLEEGETQTPCSNFVACVWGKSAGATWGLAYADISTGMFRVVDVPDLAALRVELYKLGPRELLFSQEHEHLLLDSGIRSRMLREDASVIALEPHHFDPSVTSPVLSSIDVCTAEMEWMAPMLNKRSKARADTDDFPEASLSKTSQIACGALALYMTNMFSGVEEHQNRLSGEILRAFFQQIVVESYQNYMSMDTAALAHLHLVGDPSVFAAIDRTVSPMGSRMLRSWLLSPLTDAQAIEQRLDAVSSLLAHAELLDELRANLRQLCDMERSATRASMRLAAPRSMYLLAESLDVFAEAVLPVLNGLPAVAAVVGGSSALDSAKGSRSRSGSSARANMHPHYKTMMTACVDLSETLLKPLKENARELSIVDYDADFIRIPDDLGGPEHEDATKATIDAVEDLEEKLRVESGIAQLKVASTRGKYFVTIPVKVIEKIQKTEKNSKMSDLPLEKRLRDLDLVQVATTKTTARFYHKELFRLERTMKGNLSDRRELARNAYHSLCDRVADERTLVKVASHVSGVVDALASLAVLASEGTSAKPYARPEFTATKRKRKGSRKSLEDDRIHIIDGRHPWLDKHVDYVPNSIRLGTSEPCFTTSCNEKFTDPFFVASKPRVDVCVITGPNASGKSSLMRQTALIQIMAQMGSFVPARACKTSIVDRLFVRAGCHDEILYGRSTFVVEMSELAAILKLASSKSLILLDEVGSTTSPGEGTALARSVVKFLAEDVRAKVMVATHSPLVASESNNHDTVHPFHMNATCTDGNVFYSHTLEPGVCGDSFGLSIAYYSGVSSEVVERAVELAETNQDPAH